MSNNIFLDTNLWIYLYAKNPPEKYQKVSEIIKNNSSLLLISTQVLGELFHVLTRKKFTSKTDAITIISDLINTFPVQAINTAEVIQAL
ncbi:MAG: PIN domain-containing protein [Nostoc sp.]|uniref:PIN domain-containing protein n=1 Tax=Nostoc sp. TaxID=1180 RepID=UPI002FF648C1